MKSTLGSTLRSVRKSKQVSLNSLADEYLSKSQISRFERGESEISCIRLMNILDKLKISLDEFLILNQELSLNKETLQDSISYIQKEYRMKNMSNLKKLLSDSSLFSPTSFEKTMLKAIIHTVDPNIMPTEEELLSLTDYLFKVEKWGKYEIILFGNCVRSLSYSTYFLLTKEMLDNTISSNHNKRLIIQLAINCLIVSIDTGEYKNALFLINKITKLISYELYYYERTVFLYVIGYFEFKRLNSNGKTKMQQAIQIFEFLGDEHLKKEFEKHYCENVENAN